MSNSPLRYPGVNPRVKVYIDAQVQASPRDISRSSPAPERSTTNILLACLACYLLTCGIFAASPRLQSQLVYLHYARWPLGDLTNLARFGIAEGRSVTISLAGNETIRGYHLMPVGPASIEGASLKDQRRDDFFDAQIRGAANIVVYLHGNAATRAHPRRIDMIKQIAAFCNAHVLAFDYRFHECLV